MKKLTGMIIAVAMLATLAMPSFAASTEPLLDTETKSITAEATTDTLQADVEKASDKVKKADASAFKNAFKELFSELNILRATATKNWETLKGMNANIKKAMEEFKKSLSSLKPEKRKAKVKAMSSTLKPLHALVKSIHTDIQTLRANKKIEWDNFHKAVKIKNIGDAETALKAIISLKSQIIEKQGDLMEVKQKILAALTVK